MGWCVMLGFSLRNAFRRRIIALLAIVGTGLGISLMFVLLSLSASMGEQLDEAAKAVQSDIVVSATDAPFAGMFLGGGTSLPLSYVEEIRRLPGVKAVSATVIATISRSALDTGGPLGTPFIGTDLEMDREVGGPTQHVVEGVSFQGEDEVIVGRNLARQARMSGQDLKLGRTFVVTPRIGGEEPLELRIVGVFETGSFATDAGMVGAIETARRIAGTPAGVVSRIRVQAASLETLGELTHAIEARFQEAEVPVQALSAGEVVRDFGRNLGILRSILLAISITSASAGGMAIFVIMLFSALERRQEFGVLKAVGWSNGNVVRGVLAESTALAMMGVLLGFGLGSVGLLFMSRLVGEVAVSPAVIVEVLFFGLGMGLLGGLYPAYRAARVSPMESLKAL